MNIRHKLEAEQLARWGRLLDRSCGEAFHIGIFSPYLELLWHTEGGKSQWENLPAGWHSDLASGHSQSLGETCNGVLAYRAETDQGPVALLAVPKVTGVSPEALSLLQATLEDVAEGIAEQLQLNSELATTSRELADRYEELHLIYDTDKHLEKQSFGISVLNAVLHTCAEQMNVDVASYVEAETTNIVTATNLSKPIANLDLVEVEMRGDLFRFVSASREPVVFNTTEDTRRNYIFTNMPYKIMACPIFLEKEMPAILVLLNHNDKRDFSNSDRRLAEVMANQLSNILRMRRMLNKMDRFSGQLAAVMVETMEAKDPYTRGHSERVQYVASRIGLALELSESQQDHLRWAALMHDIGKIGIPDAVLCKPGRLTPDEYTFIKVHPERSYEIIKHIDHLHDSLPGVRHHQERWDGNGYPAGLAGTEIPLLARIIAVADTYDSITSSRAYRPGRTHEDALEEIIRVSGTQLDPRIVGIFQKICEDEPAWIAELGIRRRPIEPHVEL